ncbi:Tat pathway signal protein [Roseomonas sp. SSH11]|uniref:Tat pathway signal protein n=1 Tax=Pararoseomonas baculiformis TaxID=2820812 RepID=A0ABS4AHC7_9PROT|nr:Tat pathway signal protein [Pararoseomonas baculiformis]MBP0446401.1 Tat pathway signal protein [Pararoseomonas baculiformis]
MPLARPFRLLPMLLMAALATGPALAQNTPAPAAPGPDAPKLSVELNRLEARNEGCRVWMLVRNPGPAVDPLRLDLVIFGKDQVVNRRIALDLGPLPAEKTMARIFDLAGTPCDGVGHILLNDVLACAPDAPAACLARLSVSSRAQGVALEK